MLWSLFFVLLRPNLSGYSYILSLLTQLEISPMRFKFNQFVQEADFYKCFNKLSEEGKSSLSSKIVKNYYTVAYNHFLAINHALNSYRDWQGHPVVGNSSTLKPSSTRVETELISLISQILSQFPSLEEIIESDTQTTDADKVLLREAFLTLKSKIDGLFILLGNPCFASKKEDS